MEFQVPTKKKYTLKGISNSSLSWFEISPRYFKDKFDGLIESEDKDYFDIGTKTHMFLLERAEFDKNYVNLKYTTPRGDKQKQFCEEYLKLKTKGKKADEDAAIRAYEKTYATDKKSTDKIKDEALKLQRELSSYLRYLEASGVYKEVLNDSTMNYLNAAEKAVKSHKLAKELLFTNIPEVVEVEGLVIRNEYNILWKHPAVLVNGEPILCSSTIDRLVIDHNNKVIKLVDLKTTFKLSKFHEESFEKYKYYRQLAFYWMAIFWLFKNEFPDKDIMEYKKETYIVALQTASSYSSNTEYPIECKVFRIGDSQLDKGEKEFTELLKQVAWHFENDSWDFPREYYESDGAINI